MQTNERMRVTVIYAKRYMITRGDSEPRHSKTCQNTVGYKNKLKARGDARMGVGFMKQSCRITHIPSKYQRAKAIQLFRVSEW